MARTKNAEKTMVFDLPFDTGAQGAKPAAQAATKAAKPKAAAKPPAEKKTAAKGAVVVLPVAKSTAAALIEAAGRSDVDPVKLAAIYDIHKKIMEDEARVAFARAFAALQEDLDGIIITADRKIEIREKDPKTGERTGKLLQSTAYSTYPNLKRALRPFMVKHGFTFNAATSPSPDGTRLLVRGVLRHILGHEQTTEFPLPAETSGSKNNVQGWGSSQSYGRRYAKIALLDIVSYAPEDQDNDGNAPARMIEGKVQQDQQRQRSDNAKVIDGDIVQDDKPEAIAGKQLNAMLDAIADCGVSHKQFCKSYGIEKVEQLPVTRYAEAIQACKDYKQKAAGAQR